jgi:hypothetical protein
MGLIQITEKLKLSHLTTAMPKNSFDKFIIPNFKFDMFGMKNIKLIFYQTLRIVFAHRAKWGTICTPS